MSKVRSIHDPRVRNGLCRYIRSKGMIVNIGEKPEKCTPVVVCAIDRNPSSPASRDVKDRVLGKLGARNASHGATVLRVACSPTQCGNLVTLSARTPCPFEPVWPGPSWTCLGTVPSSPALAGPAGSDGYD